MKWNWNNLGELIEHYIVDGFEGQVSDGQTVRANKTNNAGKKKKIDLTLEWLVLPHCMRQSRQCKMGNNLMNGESGAKWGKSQTSSQFSSLPLIRPIIEHRLSSW